MIDEIIHELKKLAQQKKDQADKVYGRDRRQSRMISNERVGVHHAISVIKDFKKQHRLDN